MSMLYQTTMPAGCAEEQELRSLIEQLSRISGQPIEMELQLSINTDSLELSTMLDNLAEALRNGKPTIAPIRANGHKKHRKQKAAKVEGVKKEPTRGPHVRSIMIKDTGEMISRFELDRRLAEAKIDHGAELHSPKHGTMRVITSEDGSTLLLVNNAGELL